MTTNNNSPDANVTNWRIDSENAVPFHVRDPVAEAFAVLEPDKPFVITYADAVKAAGHSCPTASGAYRTAQLGLNALYPDDIPVRGEIEVTVCGPKDDPTDGVASRIISYVTGVAEADGFGGLTGGYGGRQDSLHFDDVEGGEPTFVITRTDTDESVQVTYHVAEVPSAGPATQALQKLIDGSATPEERDAFSEAWHGRIERILADDDLFTVERTPSPE